MSRDQMRKQLKRFSEAKSGLAWIWTTMLLTIFFIPIIVWPLNSALLLVEESLGYAFTGPDLFAFQVINIATSYILFFVVIACVMKALILSKAENAGAY